MKLRIVTTATAAMISLSACSHKQAATDNGAAADNGTASSEAAATNAAAAPAVSAAQAFANTAAASDAFEIQSSQLAATNGSSKSVKAFAQRMITAHTASTAKLKAAAGSASPAIVPDATLTADQQQKLADLKSKFGAAFDSAYVDDQIAAHQAALDGLRSYSASGDVPALKDFATQLIPTITAHLNAAKGLKH